MPSVATEYARRLYDDVDRWYQSADGKAQVVLIINGAFLSFLTTSIFTKPADLRLIVSCFPTETRILLVVMSALLIGSIGSAVACLRSRVYTAKRLAEFVADAKRTYDGDKPIPPQTLWFFQMLATLDRNALREALASVDEAFEIEALSSQIAILSRNVKVKHRLVNAGFLLASGTLVVFFFAGVSYLRACGQ